MHFVIYRKFAIVSEAEERGMERGGGKPGLLTKAPLLSYIILYGIGENGINHFLTEAYSIKQFSDRLKDDSFIL